MEVMGVCQRITEIAMSRIFLGMLISVIAKPDVFPIYMVSREYHLLVHHKLTRRKIETLSMKPMTALSVRTVHPACAIELHSNEAYSVCQATSEVMKAHAGAK
jgi:hypothetical protein